MKHNAGVPTVRPVLVVFSSRKTPVAQRLSITPWQTHSWVKKIIKLGSARTAERKLKPGAKRSNSLNLYVSFAHQRHHA